MDPPRSQDQQQEDDGIDPQMYAMFQKDDEQDDERTGRDQCREESV